MSSFIRCHQNQSIVCASLTEHAYHIETASYMKVCQTRSMATRVAFLSLAMLAMAGASQESQGNTKQGFASLAGSAAHAYSIPAWARTVRQDCLFRRVDCTSY